MRKRYPAFTLAEVLIALALMGVIAAFTIPKTLQMVGNQHKNSATKETLAAISEAYQLYLKDNGGSVARTMTLNDLLPYLNGLEMDTTSKVDNRYMGILPNLQCSPPPHSNGAPECYRLVSGTMIILGDGSCMGGQAPENALPFQIDYDGKLTGVNDNLRAFLHVNGRISYENTLGKVVTYNNCTLTDSFDPSEINPLPPWFQ